MSQAHGGRIDAVSPDRADGRGWFVVFEGGEGSGKSTQAAILASRTGALLTHQPGATVLGARLRELLLGGEAGDLADRSEALLMAADRAQHVDEVIRPALEAGRAVVCDRYIGSSVAYQGHGRGLDPEEVARISHFAVDGLLPDLVIYLKVDPQVSSIRTGGPTDRIEAAGADFHRRVAQGFDSQAGADPRRWVVIDGSGTVDAVAEMVTEALAERLELP